MPVIKALRNACGTEQVRDATDADIVDGVGPAYVAAPRDAAEVAAVMAVAADHDLRVVVRGAATKLDWGNAPSGLDLVVDISGLDAVIEHAAGDLIVRVQPGVQLRDLQLALAPAGQRLAVDEVVAGSTIGGVIATGLAGPSRFLYGGVRDLLIGVTVVRADGVVARSGGRVVKNVAGYDLCKLYTGSYGTLGVITEAIFRLHPVPEASAYVSILADDEHAVGAHMASVLASQVVATAIEIDRPVSTGPTSITVLLEGFGPGVSARAARLAALLGNHAIVSSDRPSSWGLLPAAATTIRLTSQISGVPEMLRATARASADVGLQSAVLGSAAAGVLYAGIGADADPLAVAHFLRAVREACTAEGGSAVVLTAPPSVKAVVDVWGEIPAIALMRQVKQSFDPYRRLSPGRFVGGI